MSEKYRRLQRGDGATLSASHALAALASPARRYFSTGLGLLLWGTLSIWALGDQTSSFEKLQQYAAQRYGPATNLRLKMWLKLVSQIDSHPPTEQLHAVNDFFNNTLAFKTDLEIWSNADYWASPLESLDKMQGDCEDFTIAKYTTLLAAGFEASKLRLVYVQAQVGPDPERDVQAHMVLAYYRSPSAEPLILDNLVPQIRLASARTDLTPVFSFDASSIWVAGQSSAYDSSQSRLSKWQSVLQRIQKEGFLE
ncbi:transglutaminase-like cysteine peptidase [Aurantivibrio plasticivorans]